MVDEDKRSRDTVDDEEIGRRKKKTRKKKKKRKEMEEEEEEEQEEEKEVQEEEEEEDVLPFLQFLRWRYFDRVRSRIFWCGSRHWAEYSKVLYLCAEAEQSEGI